MNFDVRLEGSRVAVNYMNREYRCDSCSWSNLCMSPPPAMEEVKETVESIGRDSQGEERTMGLLMGAMVFGGSETRVKVCPVLAYRLRVSRKLNDDIRAMMLEWIDE